METVPYRNFPKEAAKIILPKWKEYRDTFGLEGDLYVKLVREGLSEDAIQRKISERRELIKELWQK